jgi:hypothetical protein
MRLADRERAKEVTDLTETLSKHLTMNVKNLLNKMNILMIKLKKIA